MMSSSSIIRRGDLLGHPIKMAHVNMMMRTAAFMIAALALIGSGVVFAQSGGEFTLTDWTLDSGGGVSSSGVYSLSGGIGQPDPGRISGGVFTLDGGFWVLPAPLISPPGSAPLRGYFTTASVPLTWNRVRGASGYRVQVSTVTTFASLVLDDHLSGEGTLASTTTPLSSGRYYWRVCAKNISDVCGAWSAVDSFTVSLP